MTGRYSRIAQTFRDESIAHSVAGDREQFLMPGGKVNLQLRKCGEAIFLDVTRTSFFEPRYVKDIVRSLKGKWTGSSCSSGGDSLAARIAYQTL